VADNVTTQTTLATIPSGTKISTDEDATNGHVQRVKLAYSADGVSTHVQADADGVLVNLGANNDVTVTGTVTANAGTNLNTSTLALEAGGNLAAAATSLALLDNAVAGNELQVDVLSVPAPLNLTGGGTEAAALRVTLATDSTGLVSVDDNGSTLSVDDGASSLTVDAPVGTPVFVRLSDGSSAIATLPVSAASLPLPTGASTLAEQQTQTASLSVLDDWDESDRAKVNIIAGQAGIAGGTGTDGATVPRVTLATNVGLPAGTNNIGDVDILSVVPGTGATNLGKLEDAGHTSGDVGVMVLAVRRDANTTLADTTGDYAPVQVDANGNLKVAVIAGGGTGGTSLTDEDAFTLGTTAFTPVGAVYNATPDTVTDGDAGALQMTTARGLHVHLVDAAGASQSVGGGTQYTEDAAAAANPVGNALNLVRDDARGGSLTTTDGDNVAARGTNAGELYVKHVDAIPVTDNSGSLTVDNAGTFAVQVSSLPASTNTIEVVGDAAHDATLAGNPVLMGGASSAAAPTDVSADGEAVRAWHLRNGAAATVITAAGALIPGDATNGLDVDVTRSALPTGASTLAEQQTQTTALALIDDTVFADDAAFTAGTHKVNAIGGYAVAHGANPDVLDANDVGAPILNRHRVQWTIGGHPNIQTSTYIWTGATTDDPVIPVVGSGHKIAVTRLSVFLDEATTVGVGVRAGFGASNVPALGSAGADGVAGILFYHPGMVPGSGANIGDGGAVIGIGGDGEDLRLTAEATTGGTGSISVSWYDIES
jgi:fibronectin-binding autotransporter adhesin